jgi:hypothetical protein
MTRSFWYELTKFMVFFAITIGVGQFMLTLSSPAIIAIPIMIIIHSIMVVVFYGRDLKI